MSADGPPVSPPPVLAEFVPLPPCRLSYPYTLEIGDPSLGGVSQRSYSLEIGVDLDVAALEIARPHGLTLGQVWTLAADLKLAREEFMGGLGLTGEAGASLYHGGSHWTLVDAGAFDCKFAAAYEGDRADDRQGWGCDCQGSSVELPLGESPVTPEALHRAINEKCCPELHVLVDNFNLLQSPSHAESLAISSSLVEITSPLPHLHSMVNIPHILDPLNPNRDGEVIDVTTSEVSNPIVQAVYLALVAGEEKSSEIPVEILDVEGMSTPIIRHFLHKLMSLLPNASYLEIGSFRGSTICSAISNNLFRTAVAIDNFAEFDPDGVNKGILLDNIMRHVGVPVTVIEGDCWDRSVIGRAGEGGPFDVYFFDGPHAEEDHRRAIVEYAHLLSDTAVIVVDDYNQQRVRTGTDLGIEEAGLEVVLDGLILSRWNQDYMGWWDGLGVKVVRKVPKL